MYTTRAKAMANKYQADFSLLMQTKYVNIVGRDDKAVAIVWAAMC